MPARLRVTLVALLLMVVALVAHTASQDSVTAGAIGAVATTHDAAAHALGATVADPAHVVDAADEPAPACPSDRRSTHDDSGTPVSRLAASGFALAVPAVFSEPAPCVGGSAALATDRSVPAVQASGVDLCTELCVSRR